MMCSCLSGKGVNSWILLYCTAKKAKADRKSIKFYFFYIQFGQKMKKFFSSFPNREKFITFEWIFFFKNSVWFLNDDEEKGKNLSPPCACHFHHQLFYFTSHNKWLRYDIPGRKLNLLNWLLLLFRCSDFYIRHQPEWKMGEMKRDFYTRDMCMGGEFMTFYRGVGFHLSHSVKKGELLRFLSSCAATLSVCD